MPRDAFAADLKQRCIPHRVRDLSGSDLHDLLCGRSALDATHAPDPAPTDPSQLNPPNNIRSHLHCSCYILLLHSSHGSRCWHRAHTDRRAGLRRLYNVGEQTAMVAERLQFLQYNMFENVLMPARGV